MQEQIRLTNWEKFREPLILDKAQQQAFEHERSGGNGGGGRGLGTKGLQKKVNKPPLRVNVINFELNGFNASIWVP